MIIRELVPGLAFPSRGVITFAWRQRGEAEKLAACARADVRWSVATATATGGDLICQWRGVKENTRYLLRFSSAAAGGCPPAARTLAVTLRDLRAAVRPPPPP